MAPPFQFTTMKDSLGVGPIWVRVGGSNASTSTRRAAVASAGSATVAGPRCLPYDGRNVQGDGAQRDEIEPAAGARLYAAAGSTSITPRSSLPLAGYEDRTGRSAGVASELEASVLVLRKDTSRVILLSADLLYVSDLRQLILEQLGERVRSAELFTAATHTHFGPATDRRLRT